jgi:hypothetical protein
MRASAGYGQNGPDFAVPLLVLVGSVAVSEMIFAAGDLLAVKRRTA